MRGTSRGRLIKSLRIKDRGLSQRVFKGINSQMSRKVLKGVRVLVCADTNTHSPYYFSHVQTSHALLECDHEITSNFFFSSFLPRASSQLHGSFCCF